MARASELNPLDYIVRRQYSDSLVIKNKLFKERLKWARNLYRKDLLAHYGCVNAIEFSNEGELLVSGGDDRRVLLWSVPEAIYGKGSPVTMQTNHTSNIFCLGFDKANSKIFSGGNDDQVIVHDITTGQLLVKLPHRNPVYGLSINPQNDYVLATAGDDGRILIFDIRESTPGDPFCLVKQSSGFHSVVFHPTNPRILVTANAEEGIALWDSRKIREKLIHYDTNGGKVSGISACFNSTGSHILALRRRLPPVLYSTQNANAVCQFYHPQYYNSCTMKTCAFAGDEDEYILSGSDDFNLYMWKIPEDDFEWGTSHIVLHGHRSIVNQVRYNKHNNLIASSGVEKMVKLWSTLPIGSWSGSLLKESTEPQRAIFSRDEYNSTIGPSTRISHDYSDHSTNEDPRMMAFFDSLIQTEIQGWESTSEETFTSDSGSDRQVQANLKFSWQSLVKQKKSVEESSKKQKPNKIAQLIAQKRNRLAKMAHWKSSTLVLRYNSREKHHKRKSTHRLKCNGNSHKFKKNNGVSSKNNTNKRITRSSSGVHRNRTESEARRVKVHAETSVLKKYRTRSQSLREFCENNASNNSFDVPSTSTGITGTSASVFRVIEQDSDEEVPPINCSESSNITENNFVNIIPTPLNGSHDMYINMLDVTNGNTNGNVVTLRNEEYASTSSTSRTHSLQCESDDDYNDSFENYINENTYLNDSSCSESDPEYNYTPIKRRRRNISEIDSGFATGSCSSNTYVKRSSRSNASCSNRSSSVNYNDRSSDDDCQYEKFKRRVKKARINIRKQIGGDSDSN